MSKLIADLVVLMLSMSVVVVMGTSEIKNTSINFTFDESTKTEFWVSKVIGFSSQHTSTRWSANQVIGPPNVYPKYGNDIRSWAARSAGKREYLELEFQQEIYITKIAVYETQYTGAVTGIRIWSSQTQTYQFVYQGRAVDLRYSRIFAPQIDTVAFKSKRIRLDLDCTVSSSWCEIDAVKIVGREFYPYFVISSNPLPEDMGQLINSSTFSDVTFMVEGRNIFAHKVVLVQRSGYFDSLFSNNSIQDLILVSGIKHSTFMTLLEFIYTGEINCSLNAPTIQGLLQMRSTYDLGGLQHLFNNCLNNTSEETALTDISKLDLRGCVTLCKDLDDLFLYRTPQFDLKECICKCIDC